MLILADSTFQILRSTVPWEELLLEPLESNTWRHDSFIVGEAVIQSVYLFLEHVTSLKTQEADMPLSAWRALCASSHMHFIIARELTSTQFLV